MSASGMIRKIHTGIHIRQSGVSGQGIPLQPQSRSANPPQAAPSAPAGMLMREPPKIAGRATALRQVLMKHASARTSNISNSKPT